MFTSLKTRLIVIISLMSFASLQAQSGQSLLRDTFCGNQTIFIGDQVFDSSRPTGDVIIPGGSFNGSDSTIHVELVFNQIPVTNLNSVLCQGDTLWVNGKPYHANFYIGQETIQEGVANGCDSIVNVNLTFRPAVYDYKLDICEGDTVYINGTAYHAFHTEGVEVIPNGACDSILNVSINAITPPFSNLRDTLCPDAFMIINGTRYDYDNRAGYEILANAAASGCDSIIAIDLEFRSLWLYIGEDREIIKGDTVCITAQYGLTPESFVWLPAIPCADSACVDNCIQVTAPATYTLLATDTSGCVLRDELSIRISTKNRVYAPNVFSPDAQWPNNYFTLNCDRAIVNIRRFFIADRWGDIVYERSNMPPNIPEEGWDGRYNGDWMNPGTYIFGAELERFDGTTFFEKGGFTLLR